MAAAGALAKHEQILVLDPPTDLKFKGTVIEKTEEEPRARRPGKKPDASLPDPSRTQEPADGERLMG